MTGIFTRWFQRNFSNPQAVVLVVFLVVGFAIILTLGDILNPLFIAIVLAYLLEWVVSTIHNKGCPRGIAVFSVFTGFIALALTTVFIFIYLRHYVPFILVNMIVLYILQHKKFRAKTVRVGKFASVLHKRSSYLSKICKFALRGFSQ